MLTNTVPFNRASWTKIVALILHDSTLIHLNSSSKTRPCPPAAKSRSVNGNFARENGRFIGHLILVRNNANIKIGHAQDFCCLLSGGCPTVPVLDWLDRLPAKVQDKCRVRIERLRDLGHELRRPEADYLRDGIYELRVGFRGMNYRMLYFFHGKVAAVLAHGLVKEAGSAAPRD
jgi:phage-related protein